MQTDNDKNTLERLVNAAEEVAKAMVEVGKSVAISLDFMFKYIADPELLDRELRKERHRKRYQRMIARGKAKR